MGDAFLQRTTSYVEKSSRAGKLKQWLTCLAVSLLCLSKGLNAGWSSPMIQILKNDGSPVGKLDPSQISMLSTVTSIAQAAGVAIVTSTLIRHGTKASAYVQAVIAIIGGVLLLVATSPAMLYAGKFLSGTTIIAVDVVSSIFLSEIASNSIRGSLITFSHFVGALGTLLAYSLGMVCSYRVFNGICLIPIVLFPIFFYFVRESPPHLVRKGQFEKAKENYIWYQGVGEETAQQYMEEMKNLRRVNLNPRIIFKETAHKRAFLISFFLLGFTELAGTSIMSTFASEIFEKAEGDLTPNQSALIMASAAFVALLVAAVLIDYCGRRILVILSLIVMTASLYVVTGYFICKSPSSHVEVVSGYAWVVYIGLSAYSAAAAIGITSVSQTLGTEMVPAGVKGVIWLFSGLGQLALALATNQIYAVITAHLSYYINFLLEAVFCTIAVVIAWWIIPETKGKSLGEITEELSRGWR